MISEIPESIKKKYGEFYSVRADYSASGIPLLDEYNEHKEDYFSRQYLDLKGDRMTIVLSRHSIVNIPPLKEGDGGRMMVYQNVKELLGNDGLFIFGDPQSTIRSYNVREPIRGLTSEVTEYKGVFNLEFVNLPMWEIGASLVDLEYNSIFHTYGQRLHSELGCYDIYFSSKHKFTLRYNGRSVNIPAGAAFKMVQSHRKYEFSETDRLLKHVFGKNTYSCQIRGKKGIVPHIGYFCAGPDFQLNDKSDLYDID